MPGAKPYTLNHVLQNPLARMLPLRRNQGHIYRMGEKIPPSALDGHGPMWEVATFSLGPLQTLQARINLQRDFTLIAIAASSSSSVSGGFRFQMYDLKKRLRFADRGIQESVLAGSVASATSEPFFLREPWRFDLPDSQILVNIQNFESVVNTAQVAFYGVVLRFNELSGKNFPGGIFSGWDWLPQTTPPPPPR